MYLTSNAKLKFRKCQFAATVSLFWKQWRVPVGHLQSALFSTWYQQRSTAAEVQKPLPKWLECGLWAGVELLYLRCSSWSFSFSLAYNSPLLTLLWLTCGLVFPATVQSKNGSCSWSCCPWDTTQLLGAGSTADLNTWGTKDKEFL